MALSIHFFFSFFALFLFFSFFFFLFSFCYSDGTGGKALEQRFRMGGETMLRIVPSLVVLRAMSQCTFLFVEFGGEVHGCLEYSFPFFHLINLTT